MKNLLISIAKSTGQIILKNFMKDESKKILQFHSKYSYSIRLDKIIENIIIKTLEENNFKGTLITEETGELMLGRSKLKLFIDPLDGSVNFSRGIQQFCISLALEKMDKTLVGVIYDPYRKNLFVAEKNKGAFLNDKKINVSKRKMPPLFVNIEWSGAKSYLEIVKKIIPFYRIRTAGSGVLALCETACGITDGTILVENKPWDIPGGALLVEEAGGIVTNSESKRWNTSNKLLLASNGLIHEDLIKLLS